MKKFGSTAFDNLISDGTVKLNFCTKEGELSSDEILNRKARLSPYRILIKVQPTNRRRTNILDCSLNHYKNMIPLFEKTIERLYMRKEELLLDHNLQDAHSYSSEKHTLSIENYYNFIKGSLETLLDILNLTSNYIYNLHFLSKEEEDSYVDNLQNKLKEFKLYIDRRRWYEGVHLNKFSQNNNLNLAV